jgi:hypothetical protein
MGPTFGIERGKSPTSMADVSLIVRVEILAIAEDAGEVVEKDAETEEEKENKHGDGGS